MTCNHAIRCQSEVSIHALITMSITVVGVVQLSHELFFVGDTPPLTIVSNADIDTVTAAVTHVTPYGVLAIVVPSPVLAIVIAIGHTEYVAITAEVPECSLAPSTLRTTVRINQRQLIRGQVSNFVCSRNITARIDLIRPQNSIGHEVTNFHLTARIVVFNLVCA